MTRRFAASLLALGLVAVSLPSLVFGQPAAGVEGLVRYRDRKKDIPEATARGEIQESAAGVKVVAGGKTVAVIAPNDILAVEYTKLEGMDPVALKIGEAKDAAKARSDYQGLVKGLTDARAKRFAEYRSVVLAARIADTKTGDEFNKEAAEAVTALTAFAGGHENAWEVYPAYRTAARLQTELGQYEKAADTYGRLAKVKGLPADLQLDARLDEAESLFRNGNAGGAAAVVGQVTGSKDFPKTGPLADRAAVLTAVCKSADDPNKAVAEVRAVIDRTADPAVRAAAHTAAGELFLQRNRPRDAMWELLWVETVYNQDRDEVAKAVSRLAVVFDKLGDRERATAYREKLPRVKGGA